MGKQGKTLKQWLKGEYVFDFSDGKEGRSSKTIKTKCIRFRNGCPDVYKYNGIKYCKAPFGSCGWQRAEDETTV